eukprot:6125211-Pyramimonas_sp.AAC.1
MKHSRTNTSRMLKTGETNPPTVFELFLNLPPVEAEARLKSSPGWPQSTPNSLGCSEGRGGEEQQQQQGREGRSSSNSNIN